MNTAINRLRFFSSSCGCIWLWCDAAEKWWNAISECLSSLQCDYIRCHDCRSKCFDGTELLQRQRKRQTYSRTEQTRIENRSRWSKWYHFGKKSSHTDKELFLIGFVFLLVGSLWKYRISWCSISISCTTETSHSASFDFELSFEWNNCSRWSIGQWQVDHGRTDWTILRSTWRIGSSRWTWPSNIEHSMATILIGSRSTRTCSFQYVHSRQYRLWR